MADRLSILLRGPREIVVPREAVHLLDLVHLEVLLQFPFLLLNHSHLVFEIMLLAQLKCFVCKISHSLGQIL